MQKRKNTKGLVDDDLIDRV